MKSKVLCMATAGALLAFSAFAQTQSGSSIGSNTGMSGSASVQGAGTSGSATAGTRLPSTDTSADTAGAAGTTAPRSPGTSVGTSGAVSGAASAGTSSGRCDTLIGDERMKCLREQASTGTTR